MTHLTVNFEHEDPFGTNCSNRTQLLVKCTLTTASRLLNRLILHYLRIQWKPVIRTSSGVEKNVLITGMFLYPVFL